MTDKNPYENQDSVDIPDFSSSKSDDTTQDIDRSIFDMDDEDEEEYEEDEEPKYRRVKQSVIIAAGILFVILLVLSIVTLVYGLNKRAAYKDLKEQYDAYQTNVAAKEADLNNQISVLKKQLEEATKGSQVDQAGGDLYIVHLGVSVRKEANTNAYADYNSLPQSIQQLCDENDGVVIIRQGSSVNVLETKTENSSEGNRVWGRIADNAWICLKQGDDEYCTKGLLN